MRRTSLLAGVLAAFTLLSSVSSGSPTPRAAPDNDTAVRLNDTGECTFGGKAIPGRPWALQRVQLDRLWQESKGKGVRVAVIDSGVDVKNKQLTSAVSTSLGKDLLKPGKNDDARSFPKGPTADMVGHGTKVAGVIAARPMSGTGFVGLAPEATIIPIRQHGGEDSGKLRTLAAAIDHAVAARAQVINISQDTAEKPHPNSALRIAIQKALAADIVVVASAGNNGADGRSKNTYPAAYDGVLAVAASDRNNERATFSQRGEFVGIAAPGVDIVSTVPKGGHCADNGTSFAAPYVAGVAALIRAKHPKWRQGQVVAQLQQTAERAVSGKDRHVGWGVVDPVRALTEDSSPINRPIAREGVEKAPEPEPAKLQLTETYAQRNERLGTYILLAAIVLTGLIATTARILRDRRRNTPF